MSRSSMKAGLLALLTVTLVSVTLLPRVRGQAKMAIAPPIAAPGPATDDAAKAAKDKADKEKNNNDFSDALTLPNDSKIKRKLEACIQYVERENWGIAVENLQQLVEQDTDVFADILRKGVDGRSNFVWVSVQSEADRLLGVLPPKGRDEYRAKNSGKAAALLAEAREKNDLELVRKVVRWYRHTAAGLEAATLLATWKLDRGRTADAAREFENILDQEGWDKVEPVETLFKASLAFQQAANEGIDRDYFLAKEAQVWDVVEARKTKTIKVSGEERPVAELREYVTKLPVDYSPTSTRRDHLYFGETPSRTGQGLGGPAYLEKLWAQDLNVYTEGRDIIIKRVLEQIKTKNQPLITPYQPVAVIGTVKGEKVPLVIYRGYAGLQAANMKRGGKVEWDSPSPLSIDQMAKPVKDGGEAGFTQAQESFLQFYFDNELKRPNLILENSAVGTITTDGTYIYMVEDFQVPPRPRVLQDDNWGGGRMPVVRHAQKVEDALLGNQLQAIDASTGKLNWRLGGIAAEMKDPSKDLPETYFLGPPLPLENKLYCLIEKSKELRLLTLEPYTYKKDGDERTHHAVRILSSQLLATVKFPIIEDVMRRRRPVNWLMARAS